MYRTNFAAPALHPQSIVALCILVDFVHYRHRLNAHNTYLRGGRVSRARSCIYYVHITQLPPPPGLVVKPSCRRADRACWVYVGTHMLFVSAAASGINVAIGVAAVGVVVFLQPNALVRPYCCATQYCGRDTRYETDRQKGHIRLRTRPIYALYRLSPVSRRRSDTKCYIVECKQ